MSSTCTICNQALQTLDRLLWEDGQIYHYLCWIKEYYERRKDLEQ